MSTDSPSQAVVHMRRALTLGLQSRGTTGDNPWVGAVVVRGDRVLGEGATQPPGQGHAEAMAIRAAEAAGHDVSGATLFTTVEPCTFHGRTPACTGLLISKRVARVVIGILDPHPRVNGLGLRMLEEAGIATELGLLADEIAESLAPWLQGHGRLRVRKRGP